MVLRGKGLPSKSMCEKYIKDDRGFKIGKAVSCIDKIKLL